MSKSKLILPPGYDRPDHNTWGDCELLSEPVSTKDLKAPKLLVRRRTGMLSGPLGEEIVCLPGLSAISLFTGCGGMDLGLERAGFCTLVQHEWAPDACATLIANRPRCFGHAALIQGDIRQTPTEMLLEAAGLRVGEAHVLTGGPPCQGFSWANSNRGKVHDTRNDLVFEYGRVVGQAKPKFFIMENVPGFCELNKGEYFKAFLQAMYDHYYELVYGFVDAVEYGVPQYRTRFICMGTRRDMHAIDGVLGSLPAAQNYAKQDLEVIKSLESGPLFEEELRLFTHAPGIRYFPDRPVLVPPKPIARQAGEHDDLIKGRNNAYVEFYRKLEREEPDRIVRAPKNEVAA